MLSNHDTIKISQSINDRYQSTVGVSKLLMFALSQIKKKMFCFFLNFGTF